MHTVGRRAPLLLFIGDMVAFAVSLYLTLWLRYGAIPSMAILAPYIAPFTLLCIPWVLVFYGAGLYSKRIVLFPSRLPNALFKTQLVNIIFAALFFFFVPIFGIAPKTILALYLFVSLSFVFLWRLAFYPALSRNRSREQIVLLSKGKEADELYTEVNGNPRYGLEFTSRVLDESSATLLVGDKESLDEATLKKLAQKGRQLIAFEEMYEEIFDRIPLSHLGQVWFRKNVAKIDPLWYMLIKRTIDIIGGVVMGLVTLVLTPCVYVANLFEGPGPLFLRQERFGKHGAPIRVYKFRSMQKDIQASSEWTHEGENRVTKVGAFLRLSSLDEFPQFINVIRGEISLIGPRSDILGLGKRLAEALPYYDARYLVVPGITGWAQINQQYEQGHLSPQSIEETKVRLAYDFYYLKHRSLGLDIVIAIKTIKRMFFRLSSW